MTETAHRSAYQPSPLALRWLAKIIERNTLPPRVLLGIEPNAIDLFYLPNGDLILDHEVTAMLDAIDNAIMYEPDPEIGDSFAEDYGRLRSTYTIDGTYVTVTVRLKDYSGTLFTPKEKR